MDCGMVLPEYPVHLRLPKEILDLHGAHEFDSRIDLIDLLEVQTPLIPKGLDHSGYVGVGT